MIKGCSMENSQSRSWTLDGDGPSYLLHLGLEAPCGCGTLSLQNLLYLKASMI